jgi:hypothetical protein
MALDLIAMHIIVDTNTFSSTGHAVKTAEQKLDELRTKQIEAMVEEQKKIIELEVPQQLARAALFEAKKRVLTGISA